MQKILIIMKNVLNENCVGLNFLKKKKKKKKLGESLFVSTSVVELSGAPKICVFEIL